MPEGVFGQKRTRSQLTLPDEILQVPQGSPLKDARNAARSRSVTTRDHPADSVVGEEIEDELLLSPQKKVSVGVVNSKRSASPQRNEYSTTGDSPTAGRELKRVKRDIFGLESNGGPTTRRAATLRSARTHSRNFSGSSLQDTKRSSSELPFSKPHSSNIAPFSLPQPDVKKGRAQSVPLFPTSSDVLHLDLRNPPPSPIRMRSTSTERDPLLRIIPRQGVAPVTLAPTPDNRPVTASSHTTNVLTDPNHCIMPPPSTTSIPIVVHLELPETPHHRSNLFPLPMSPLTPLPETPQPSKVKPSALKHQPIVGGTMDSLKATQIINAIGPTLTSHDSVIPTIPTSGYNLPEPTTSRALVPPSPSPAAASGSIAPNIGTKMVRAKPLPASRNAFNVLMSNAQSSKTGKGKGKAITPSHVGPKVGGPNFSRTQKASMIEGSKPRGDNQQKPSVKAKMKPREKPKPKPVPVPVPAAAIIEPADESDRMAPQQQAHSPAFSSVEVPIMSSRESSEEPATQIEPEPQTRHTADDTQGSVPQPQSQPPPIPESKSQARVELFLNSAKPQPIPPGEQAGAQQRIARIPRNPKRIIARPPVGRVTRSASGKGKGEDIGEMKQANINGIPTSSSTPVIPITAASRAGELKPDNVYTDFSTSNSSLTDLTDSGPEINPGSPMRISSPARLEKDASLAPHKPASTSVVTPTTPKMLSKFRSPSKPMSSPSPTKLVRSSSMFATRPTALPTRSAAPGSGASILSTLSNALEKLSMPPPPRPNTSMGFNRNLDDEDNDEDNASIKFGAGAKDDVSIRQRIFGSSTGAQWVATLGSSSLADRPITTGNVAKKSSYISRPILPDTTRLRTGNGLIMQGGKFLVDNGGRSRIFGTGSLMGRSGGKASKKSSLPSVMASPVKGGTNIDPTDSGYTADQPNTLSLNSTSSAGPSFDESESEDKAARQSIWRRDTARRISLATASLSQSLNSLPPNPPNPLGFLGPPAFPVGLGHAMAPSNPPLAGPSSRLPTATRAGVKTRSATTIPKARDGTIVHVPMKTNSTATAQTLKILDECVIFVDVRSDDGEEAGSLFTEMLEGVGAKILTRVGKTCTHIVYKNGLMSTLNRYRLLQDPKPLVVGIGWVVECVEKRARVDESRFQVDLEGVNVAGTNKRRRSMLPKMIARDINDVGSSDTEREHARDMHPLDRSSSSITLDDNLPPLEKARRRKSMLIGPRT